MSNALRLAQPARTPPATPMPAPLSRHRCSCGGAAGPSGHCADCAAKARQGQPASRAASLPDAMHEAEAERVAQQAMTGSAPSRTAQGPPPPRPPASRGGGMPLPPALRSFFEPRLGQGLGHVRLHADAVAASEARALRAQAFTRGGDISFAAGHYDPASAAGRRLLAHELTHTLQQGGAPSFRPAAWGAVQRAPDPDAPVLPQAPVLRGMLGRLQEWNAAGLLDAPFRPATVGAIPPLPVSQKTAAKLGLNTQPSQALSGPGPAVLGGAAAAKLVEPVVTATRPVLTVIEGGEVLAAAKPIPAPAGGPLRMLGPLAIGLTVFLWPSETAPPWLDELNPVTGEPYGSPEEYKWVRRLTPEQADYLRRLDQAKREQPDPTLEAERDPELAPEPTTTLAPEPMPGPVADPVPQPDPRKKDRDRRCVGFDVPRRGGHKVHDAYADKVSKSLYDYFASPPVPFRGINYDGRTPMTPVVWEVKVGHGWFFRPDKAALRDLTLARWDAQKDLGMSIARQCGYLHLWSIPDRWLAGMLNTRWAGVPSVLAVPR